MLGIEPRAARAVWTVLLVALAAFLLYRVRRVLFVLFAAVLLAYLLAPVLNLLNRFTRRRLSRALSLAVVYLLLLGLVALFGAVVGNRVSQDAAAMAAKFPDWAKNLETELRAPEPQWLAPAKQAVANAIREKLENLGQAALPLIQQATAGVMSLVGGLIILVIVPVLSFFLLKDGAELKARALSGLSRQKRALWEDVLADVHRLLGQFIRALVLLSAATFVAYGAAFALMGIPYALLLATVAGVLEFIPVLGPLAAAATIVLVVIISGHGSLWGTLAFLGAYRLFQDYVLQPHLMSAGLALHPVLVIAGALAGEAIAGAPGMFLSVPVMATLRILYLRLVGARRPAEWTA